MTAGRVWRNRIVGHADVAPGELVPNPRNWRSHPPEQQRALAGALGEVGWVAEVLVNQTTGNVVDGHLRIELALSRHEPTVPITYVELSEDEERLVLASLDPLAAMATSEQEQLAALLDGLAPADEALRALLDDLARENDLEGVRRGLADPDDVPEVPDEPYVQPGDLWVLGEHRLLCADATDATAVRSLVEEDVDIVWTDPPYGLDYVGKTKDRLRIDNDQADQTRALLADALRLAPLKPGGAFYVTAPSGDMEMVFRQALDDVAWRLRQQLVWMKDVFVMGRQDYHWRHESILYGWQDGAAHHWAGGRTQDTVWEIPRPKRSESHPTMKPVELVARALANSSRPLDRVYDPFAGSGTSIIAAEQLGRRCYALEIDPRYVQVSIERWQAFTGKTAVRVDGLRPTRSTNGVGLPSITSARDERR